MDADVAVVGAGPVGLYLAARLAAAGISVTVLEQRAAPSGTSRAIGIHPPALEALDEVGAAEPLVARGVRVLEGAAYRGSAGGLRRLGRLRLEKLPGRYGFVLCVPQQDTEAVLEERLQALAPGVLRRGRRVEDAVREPDGVALRVEGVAAPVRARVVASCEGADASLADRLGLRARGGRYPDTYLMADLRDDGPLSPEEGAVILSPEGVVEAFPLPGGMRRWVARTESREVADAVRLAELVRVRTGVALDPATARMVSAFGTRWRLAERLARDDAWLVGDAAHVVSPIGGQGMNLGWLGAREAAEGIAAALASDPPGARVAESRYDRAQRARASASMRRAAWNMRLGRPSRFAWARDAAVRGLLSPPMAGWSARLFTMQA